jgi:hypothetical protein
MIDCEGLCNEAIGSDGILMRDARMYKRRVDFA